MDPDFIRTTIINRAHQLHETFEEAGRNIINGFRLEDPEPVLAVVDQLIKEAQQIRILDAPPGVASKPLEHEVKLVSWYVGPQPGDKMWWPLRERITESGMKDFVNDIDLASTKVVAQLAHPAIRGTRKKGLVVGYVQSGKTANYTSVIAKASDAGYRLVIVLSGLHNNLRRQTQRRLVRDLAADRNWFALTTDEADFGTVTNGTALMATKVPMFAVVKKNASRLKRLRDWLQSIPEETRRRCPVLLLDDEADQATPNTKAARDDMSVINRLVREVWSEIPSGTYVGYTATPFANVFMDPNDETDMYPEDFIVDLPRPSTYFGAERIFGIGSGADGDDDEGLDMVRTVSDEEAERLQPRGRKEDRDAWTPEVTSSLDEAIIWFLVATAARRARQGIAEHSSMLVHTSQFVAAHFKMKDLLQERLWELQARVDRGDLDDFKASFDREYGVVDPMHGNTPVSWEDTAIVLPSVLGEARIVVDNGVSTDRVDYGRLDEMGNEIAETVIAVGGGTLSRGLTLEGLVVSYFTRNATTYDTLLQMGRWFGFRPGYEELPRIWVTDSVSEQFQFLALVEAEIREEMQRMETLGVTPAQMGLRVRAHPGNLAITAKNKMVHADFVQISYSGQRHQTIWFDETDEVIQRTNLDAVHRLGARCRDLGQVEHAGTNKLFRDVPTADVAGFLSRYVVHPAQLTLQREHVTKWLQGVARDASWNVAFMSRSDARYGTVDVGLTEPVNSISRAPLATSEVGEANIKALMGSVDAVLDLGREVMQQVSNREATFRDLRALHADGSGLLLIYPISENSEPTGASARAQSRRHMESTLPLMGIGVVFPELLGANATEDATFVAVRPELAKDTIDDFDEDIEFAVLDTEGDATIDGAALAGAVTND